MNHTASPQSEFLRGIKECSPMLIGLLPWALILGMQGGQKGMSWLEMLLMTGMNFAGGSEFAAVNLWANPLPIMLIATVTFMINSRHILMGAAIALYMRDMPLKKAMPALFLCVMKAGQWHLLKFKSVRRQVCLHSICRFMPACVLFCM